MYCSLDVWSASGGLGSPVTFLLEPVAWLARRGNHAELLAAGPMRYRGLAGFVLSVELPAFGDDCGPVGLVADQRSFGELGPC